MKTPLSLLVLLLAFSPSLSAQTTNIPASPANASNTSKDISSKAPTPGTVNLVKQGGQYLVTGETYTAVVPDNGLLLAQPTNRVENKEDGGKGAHYTHIGLIHHAGMWSDKLIPWIESQLAP